MTAGIEEKMLVKTQIKDLQLPGDGLGLKHGGILKKVEIAYEAYGPNSFLARRAINKSLRRSRSACRAVGEAL